MKASEIAEEVQNRIQNAINEMVENQTLYIAVKCLFNKNIDFLTKTIDKQKGLSYNNFCVTKRTLTE